MNHHCFHAQEVLLLWQVGVLEFAFRKAVVLQGLLCSSRLWAGSNYPQIGLIQFSFQWLAWYDLQIICRGKRPYCQFYFITDLNFCGNRASVDSRCLLKSGDFSIVSSLLEGGTLCPASQSISSGKFNSSIQCFFAFDESSFAAIGVSTLFVTVFSFKN